MGDQTGDMTSSAAQHPLLAFADLMRVLRDGCAWKQQQTHVSLKRFLLEEAYEVLEAIDEGEASGDFTHLREELGDLLLQVYFHALIAEERGEFTIADVAADIDAKMRRRNPHVIGPTARPGLTPDEIDELWQQAKAAEKAAEQAAEQAAVKPSGTAAVPAPASPAEGVPAELPALMWASKVLGRAERAGTPLDLAGTHAPDAALGERLLALVAEARAAGVDAEQALRAAVRGRL